LKRVLWMIENTGIISSRMDLERCSFQILPLKSVQRVSFCQLEASTSQSMAFLTSANTCCFWEPKSTHRKITTQSLFPREVVVKTLQLATIGLCTTLISILINSKKPLTFFQNSLKTLFSLLMQLREKSRLSTTSSRWTKVVNLEPFFRFWASILPNLDRLTISCP
jgi:hypothetical protein